jgi:hypothetical protein
MIDCLLSTAQGYGLPAWSPQPYASTWGCSAIMKVGKWTRASANTCAIATTSVANGALAPVASTDEHQISSTAATLVAKMQACLSLLQCISHMAASAGILLADVGALSPCANILHPGDVILEVGGRQVSNDGTVEFRWEVMCS